MSTADGSTTERQEVDGDQHQAHRARSPDAGDEHVQPRSPLADFENLWRCSKETRCSRGPIRAGRSPGRTRRSRRAADVELIPVLRRRAVRRRLDKRHGRRAVPATHAPPARIVARGRVVGPAARRRGGRRSRRRRRAPPRVIRSEAGSEVPLWLMLDHHANLTHEMTNQCDLLLRVSHPAARSVRDRSRPDTPGPAAPLR